MKEFQVSSMNGYFSEETLELYLERYSSNNNKIVTMTRIRNESLILKDFLEHLSSFSDAIIVFDDASYDDTLDICRKHEKVCAIIRNNRWSSQNRTNLETRHRARLLEVAKSYFNFDWFCYLDADERLVGDVRDEILSLDKEKVHYFRIPLYDAYLTEEDHQAFTREDSLLNSRIYYGPERRDIIFGWNENANPNYILDDSREPSVDGDNYVTILGCQHFGKAISMEKWDEKCHYYIDNFPYEPYGKKWQERIGRSIHIESDFNTPLYVWGKELFENSIKIHPVD